MQVSTSFNTTAFFSIDPSCANCATRTINIKAGHPQPTMSLPVRAHLSFAEKKLRRVEPRLNCGIEAARGEAILSSLILGHTIFGIPLAVKAMYLTQHHDV